MGGKRLSPTVTNLTVARSGNRYKATWKVPSRASDSKYSDSFTGIEAAVYTVTPDGKTADIRAEILGKTASSLSTVERNSSGVSKNLFDRSKYYPYTSKKLSYIRARVRGRRSISKKRVIRGDYKRFSYDFSKPAKPTVADIAFDKGVLTFVVSTKDSSGTAERAYVNVKIWRKSNFEVVGGVTQYVSNPKETLVYDENVLTSVGASSKTINRTEAYWSSMTERDQYVHYRIKAVAKGINGDSASVERELTICYATRASISGVSATSSIVTVYFSFITGDDGNKHVDECHLQYADSLATPTNDQWQDVPGAVHDGGGVRAISFGNTFTASPGNYVWVRVVTKYLADNMSQASEPFRIDKLYNRPPDATASTSEIGILDSSEAGSDGTSLTVITGWNADDYSGTEVSWTTDPDGWRSTEDPKSKMLPDASWRETGPEYPNYAYGTKLKIVGLEEDTAYYLKSRRYNVNDPTQVSGWTDAKEIVTGALAAGVTLSAPLEVADGDAVRLMWLVGGGKVQSGYTVYINGAAVGSGNGAENSFVFTPNGSGVVEAYVEIKSNGTVSRSNAVRVTVKPKPMVTSITTEQTVTAKPHQVSVTCDHEGASIRMQLVSCGNSEQYAGEIVWDDESSELSRAIPAEAMLVEGSEYVLRAVATIDGIKGDVFTASWQNTTEDGDTIQSDRMSVLWAHQAVPVVVCAIAVDSENMAAEIAPQTPPEGISETDTMNVYRVTPDGPYLIAQGVAFGSTITDRWSPFGGSYRIETVTADGDADYMDFEYELPSDSIRIDWPGGVVSLHYSANSADQWRKDVEVRKYLDGTSEAWHNEGAVRTKSIGGVFIIPVESDSATALRALASYSGTAFVRTPRGEAFEADVQCSVSDSVYSPLMTVSLTATEVVLKSFVCSGGDVNAG